MVHQERARTQETDVNDVQVVAGDQVGITLPASSAYVAVLRTAAAGVAARMEFTLDDVEDLRMLVDEACAVLLPAARSGTSLEARFDVDADGLGVSVAVVTSQPWQAPRDSFAWTVLTALGDPVDVSVNDDHVTVSFRKKRG
jgi:serine/threonine-protein kinase RsbW